MERAEATAVEGVRPCRRDGRVVLGEVAPEETAPRRSSASTCVKFPGKQHRGGFHVGLWKVGVRVRKDFSVSRMVIDVATNRSAAKFGPREAVGVGKRRTRTRNSLVSQRQASLVGSRQGRERQAAEDK